MSGPHTEDPTLPPVDPEWLRRFEAKMADLEAAREERMRNARPPAEGPEAWAHVEELVDQVHLERVERIIEKKRRES